MAISTADFKNGMCIEFNGKLCTIVEFQHVKPGKGSAFVRTKLRDIKTAASSTTRSRRRQGGVRAPRDEEAAVPLQRRCRLQLHGQRHLRADGHPGRHRGRCGEVAQGERRGVAVVRRRRADQHRAADVRRARVTHTEPGFKGDTATNTTKPATLETGVEVQVPTFVEIGDVLQIDTRDGRFINACSKRETPTRLNGNEGADGRLVLFVYIRAWLSGRGRG